MVKLIKKKEGISNKLNGLIDRTKSSKTFLQLVLYPMYQNMQMARWMSENTSEGAKWASLTPRYKAYKAIKFVNYPGSGTKMLIAKGRLFGSVVGPKAKSLGFDTSDHRKLITNSKLKVQSATSYARHVAEKRPFMEFGQASKDQMKRALKAFILHNRRTV